MKNPKIVFLDRDGVINQMTPGNYIRHYSEFRLLPKAKEALAKLTRSGYEIHIISNQQGVGKGLMTRTQLSEISQLLMERVEQAGGKINSINYCIHLESEKCDCRKPKIGLFRQAVDGRKINFKQTWMIGDSWRDIEAGQSLGCKTIWIGETQYLPKKPSKVDQLKRGFKVIDNEHEFQPDYCSSDLYEAAKLILRTDE